VEGGESPKELPLTSLVCGRGAAVDRGLPVRVKYRSRSWDCYSSYEGLSGPLNKLASRGYGCSAEG